MLHGDCKGKLYYITLLLQQMIYSSDLRVNITRVQIGVCGERDVVPLMQNWIHPHLPVAAAADIVFHIRPACWQCA